MGRTSNRGTLLACATWSSADTSAELEGERKEDILFFLYIFEIWTECDYQVKTIFPISVVDTGKSARFISLIS